MKPGIKLEIRTGLRKVPAPRSIRRGNGERGQEEEAVASGEGALHARFFVFNYELRVLAAVWS